MVDLGFSQSTLSARHDTVAVVILGSFICVYIYIYIFVQGLYRARELIQCLNYYPIRRYEMDRRG